MDLLMMMSLLLIMGVFVSFFFVDQSLFLFGSWRILAQSLTNCCSVLK